MLFVTPSQDFSEKFNQEHYTLVLSPHYYWCKKSERQFKNIAQAKKFAPSFFDLAKSYTYDVYTQEGELFFMAFDLDAIKERLISQGVDLTKVDRIYLAQAFFNDFKKAVVINETEALVRLNGVVAVVEQKICQELDAESELASFASLKMLSLKMSGLGDRKSSQQMQLPLILIASTAALWIITIFINLWMTQSELENKQQALRDNYQLPATSFQLKSMVKRLEKVNKEQTFMREMLYSLSKEKRAIKGSLRSVALTSKSLEASFAKRLTSKVKLSLQTKMKRYAQSVSFIQDKKESRLKVQR